MSVLPVGCGLVLRISGVFVKALAKNGGAIAVYTRDWSESHVENP